MAIMYPDKPKEFSINSKEDLMFEALAKLPDSYYVFHSFKIVNIIDNSIYESETDFVIFHPQKGILCIEAKAGNVKYEEGKWKYGSNIEMSHDGPFHQASNNKWKISTYIKNNGLEYLLNKCKLLHAVWFPSISKEKFSHTALPPEADINLMLTSESIDNIESDISRIFEIHLPNNVETILDSNDISILLNRVLAPKFNLVSIAEMKLEHKKQAFKKMLDEQVALLNYLEEQNNAIINGMAGTGKTVMAIEKARRHSNNNEKVLFLCYNYYLKEYLKENYHYDNVDFYTIDGLACKLTNSNKADYNALNETLLEMYDNKTFPYKHIIIDEGQDFGMENIEEQGIIEALKLNVIDNERVNGTFYLFYDKNQMIQSKANPSYISESDCKLTLYKNCRNTINIARTSLRFLGNNKTPIMYDGALIGEQSDMYFSTTIEENVHTLNYLIEKLNAEKYTNIQILTCKTEKTSVLKNECSSGSYLYKNKKYPFTTCRKYKGLEADAVILVDVDKDLVQEEFEQILYVGSSRAKYKLNIISNLNEEDCNLLLDKLEIRRNKNCYKTLATAFNSKYVNLKIEQENAN